MNQLKKRFSASEVLRRGAVTTASNATINGQKMDTMLTLKRAYPVTKILLKNLKKEFR